MTAQPDASPVFVFASVRMETVGELLDGAVAAAKAGRAREFLAEYRRHTEHADVNLGYIIGYLEPRIVREQIRFAFFPPKETS